MPTKVAKHPPNIIKSFRLIDFQAIDSDITHSDTTKSDSGSDKTPSDNDSPKQFTIQMFGINELGETCSITVTDFKPFFFIMVGPNWTAQDAMILKNELQSKIHDDDGQKLLKCELVEFAKLYGFAPGVKDKFCRVEFENHATMKKVVNFWYKYDKVTGKRTSVPYTFTKARGKINLILYETFIPPLLRYFHINNISPSGWVSIQVSKMQVPPQKTTTCKYEYTTQAQYVIAQPDKETPVPYKICSFDIEASSSHGDFPQPVKTYKRLAGNIVDYLTKHGGHLTDAQIDPLISRCIMAAFGYKTFDDVDRVFTKGPPITKESCKVKIDSLLTKPLNEAINLDEQAKETKELDTYFTKMHRDLHAKKEEDDDNSSVHEGEDDDEDADDQDEPVVLTIKSYLLNPHIPIKQKKAKLDQLLMSYFPKLEGDQITMIGSTFMRFGEPVPYLNTCIVVNTCDDVPNSDIISCPTEQAALLRWTDLIQEEDPDIIIGYNIFNFDYPFMFQRAKELSCVEPFLLLSRQIGHISANLDNKTKQLVLGNNKVTLSSGEYNLYYPIMIGRLQIDLLPWFRREFNYPSYTLDNVSATNISDHITCIDETGTRLTTQNVTGLQPMDYIHVFKKKYTENFVQGGEKFYVLDVQLSGKQTVITLNKPITDPINFDDQLTEIKWGLAKDDVSVQDIFRLTGGSAADRAIVAKYCIQDCNIVQHLFKRMDTFTSYSEMSRLCSVPITMLVFRGQGIKLTSFVAKKCREKGTLMPDLTRAFTKGTDGDDDKDQGYEGAVVLPPKCGIYIHNPVACLDYSSLYPSLMQSQNLSHDSKVWTKEYDLAGNLIKSEGSHQYDNLPNYTYVDIEFDTYNIVKKKPTAKKGTKVKSGVKVCRWAKAGQTATTDPKAGTADPKAATSSADPKAGTADQKAGQTADLKAGNNQGFVAILPAIVDELLKTRKATKKRMKDEPDQFMKNILDKRQMAYKLTANSLYGQCGAPTSTFYDKDIASCITAMGRRMIMYAKRMVEEVYGNRLCPSVKAGSTVRTRAEYVYGDTDSVFFTFNLEDSVTGQKIIGKPALEITIELAQQVAAVCSKFLTAPMELCYEKTLMPFIIFSKKRYVGVKYETDSTHCELKIMGLSIKRRDSCDYMKDVYGGILDIFIDGQPTFVSEAVACLNRSLTDLMAGRVTDDKLTITKAIRSEYARPESQAHWVLSERIGARDPGNKPKSGDRVAFMYFENNRKVAKGTKILTGDIIETPQYIRDHQLKVDYGHYIEHQLMKPIAQLFGLALEDIYVYLNKPIELANFNRYLEALHKECGDDLQAYAKKREKYTSAKIQELLFRNALTAIYNKRNGITQITNVFGKKAR